MNKTNTIKMFFPGMILATFFATQLVFAATTVPQTPQGKNAFSDVQVGSTYYNAVLYLKNKGIISGYADGTFKPGNPINRAEFTKVVVEASTGSSSNGLCIQGYAGEGPNHNLFKDVITSTNPWYLNDLCVAFSDKWVSGYPDGNFLPDRNINFAEAAKIIVNIFKLSIPATTDSDPWYKGFAEALASQNAIPVSINRFSQFITRGEMAEIMYRIVSKNTGLSSITYAKLQ